MASNRLKHFPTAVLRRGMVHFHPPLPAPGQPPRGRDERRDTVWTGTGGPRPTAAPGQEPAEPGEP